MKREAKYTTYIEWTIMLVLLIGILVISKQLGFADSLKPESRTGRSVMLIGTVIMGFIVLAVHELGHLIAGLINDFRFELFVVGPLGIKREKDKIKIYLNKDLASYGGMAATSPKDDHKDNAKNLAYVLLAGPIASVLFALLCFGGSYLAGKPMGIVFYTDGLISVGIFFATTIPSRTGMFFTDRKRYQRLVNPGKDQDVELAMLRIMGKFSKDGSYKNVDKNDINTLVTDDLDFIKYYGLFNLICFQVEHDGVVEEEVLKDYREMSGKMSKTVVSAFNKELDKYKEKFKVINKLP